MHVSFFFAEKSLKRLQHAVSGGSCLSDADDTALRIRNLTRFNSSDLCFMVETHRRSLFIIWLSLSLCGPLKK